MTKTDDDQAERLRAAAQEFGKALGDSLTNLASNIKTARRKAFADSLVDEFGPGPWVLDPDGTVKPISTTPSRGKVSEAKAKAAAKKVSPIRG